MSKYQDYLKKNKIKSYKDYTKKLNEIQEYKKLFELHYIFNEKNLRSIFKEYVFYVLYGAIGFLFLILEDEHIIDIGFEYFEDEFLSIFVILGFFLFYRLLFKYAGISKLGDCSVTFKLLYVATILLLIFSLLKPWIFIPLIILSIIIIFIKYDIIKSRIEKYIEKIMDKCFTHKLAEIVETNIDDLFNEYAMIQIKKINLFKNKFYVLLYKTTLILVHIYIFILAVGILLSPISLIGIIFEMKSLYPLLAIPVFLVGVILLSITGLYLVLILTKLRKVYEQY